MTSATRALLPDQAIPDLVPAAAEWPRSSSGSATQGASTPAPGTTSAGCASTSSKSRGRFGRERRDGPAKVREGTVDGYDLVTARPQTYMNVSGRAAVHLLGRYGVPPTDLMVVHDDVDLPLGRLRLKRGGGAAGNKGVLSIADSLRTQDFLRVRIGVSRPAERDQMVDYVLDRFTPGRARTAGRGAAAGGGRGDDAGARRPGERDERVQPCP